jgi:hypothetical protein
VTPSPFEPFLAVDGFDGFDDRMARGPWRRRNRTRGWTGDAEGAPLHGMGLLPAASSALDGTQP